MAKAQTFDLACNTCEEIGPCLIVGRAVRGRPHSGRPRAGAAAGLAAWAQFTKSHGGHDIRLLAEGYDHVIPLEKGGEDTEENCQGLCDECHKAKTAEDRGYSKRRTIGLDGYPVDG